MFQTALALVVFLFPLAFSPGPGNMFFAANGARFGLRVLAFAPLLFLGVFLVAALFDFFLRHCMRRFRFADIEPQRIATLGGADVEQHAHTVISRGRWWHAEHSPHPGGELSI